MLQALQPLSPQAILATLINELSDSSNNFVLVLDDYQFIESSTTNAAVTFLVDHIPPSMHLVIATRADPPLALARWRARNQMVELRTEDLRFTPKEVFEFLRKVMELDLAEKDIAALREPLPESSDKKEVQPPGKVSTDQSVPPPERTSRTGPPADRDEIRSAPVPQVSERMTDTDDAPKEAETSKPEEVSNDGKVAMEPQPVESAPEAMMKADVMTEAAPEADKGKVKSDSAKRSVAKKLEMLNKKWLEEIEEKINQK
jgi:hypothetical protein